ncbi:methyltransferase, FxLD system [Hamadaea tsunoensis]|uniref:methyltransferase, FxLD system n=1 Tax=Hamadaea tsunoensis TaxID=53368 RepID=UPI00041C9B97|nr:methyltransferase, FxLD system [Hamadaea tsunoensis]
MSTAADVPTDLDPKTLRRQLAEQLLAAGHVTRDTVAAAFRTVPRHLFMLDGVDLATAYDADQSPVTKRNEAGAATSSVSAPWLQGRMIEQADIRPGMRVLEIGSGGYNAALIAEVVGPTGRVVTVDIDRDITDCTSRRLDATGYGRIRVVQADGNRRIPGEHELFDAIVVTVGTHSVPPAWMEQLAPHGILVVPLDMGGTTRSIAFRRDGNRLESLSAEVCGFVPMQGDGEHAPTIVSVPGTQAAAATLRFAGPAPAGLNLPDNLLSGPPVQLWSGETIGNSTDWSDLYLWFSCYMPGACTVTVPDDSPLRTPGQFFFPKGNARDDSLAVFVIRRLDDGSGCEWGATGYGTHGVVAAEEMISHIQQWNRTAGPTRPPTYTFIAKPNRPQLQPHTTALAQHHGALLIHWPTSTD